MRDAPLTLDERQQGVRRRCGMGFLGTAEKGGGMSDEVVLETARMVFRLWSEGDVAPAMQIWGDVDVMSLLGGPMSEEGVRARLAGEQRNWRDHGVTQLHAEYSDTLKFGDCLLSKVPGAFKTCW